MRNALPPPELAQLDAALARIGGGSDPFAAVVWATRMPIVVTNPRLADNPMVFVNDAFCNLTGYSRAEMIGRNCRCLQGPQTDPASIARLREAVMAQLPLDIELRNYKKDGAPFWNRLHMVPLRDASGALTYFFASQLDVTIERERLASLESQNAVLLAALAARQQADLANAEKSRFLAVASHDIRQPLQSLVLLQGILARMVQGEGTEKLVTRLGQTLDSMSSMLNSLLDLNQIEAGAVRMEIADIRVGDILSRLRDGFAYDAQAKGLTLHVVPCSLYVRSDPRLLEQMIRNLIANAVKYTRAGRVLVGCRRHGFMLRIEVWDTGVGIPTPAIEAIFREYHQIDNAGRSRSGLGLGLAIVRRFAALLDHRIIVRSDPGRGSMFAIDLPVAEMRPAMADQPVLQLVEDGLVRGIGLSGTILLIDDDPETCEILQTLLQDEGYTVAIAGDGIQALAIVQAGEMRPDLILTDSRLPPERSGPAFIARLRHILARDLPVITLTGDVCADTVAGPQPAAPGGAHTLRITKPIKPRDLTRAIQRMLSAARSVSFANAQAETTDGACLAGSVVFVVDDNEQVSHAIRAVIEADGGSVETYASSEAFLAAYRPARNSCLLLDAYMPGMGGIDLLRQLRQSGDTLPAIMITGNSDVAMAVQAMKAGASDFIEKPVGAADLLASIHRAIHLSRDSDRLASWRETASTHLGGLTARQRQIMAMVLAGHPSKNIASDLHISQRTVENHRAAIMRKTGTKSLPALARLALAADWDGADGPLALAAEA